MRRAIRNYSTDAIAVAVLAIIAVFVGGYILANQRFYLPGWVPFVGTNFYTLNAELQTAQAITPGQGQVVAMAGVPVGEISQVELKNGRAVVTMKIESQYAKYVHRNSTILTRPKTGLNDMLLQLDPGTASSGSAPDGYTIPVSQTLPNVNPDEILASLDTGTRNYLKLLIGGAGEGLRGNRKTLSAVLRRFDPTARDVAKITRLLSQRHEYVARSIHNLRLISEALAGKDKELTQWVDSSNKVFSDFAAQDANLRQALSELPTALNATNQAVISANTLGQTLGPTLSSLEPFARYLAPASIATQNFFNETTGTLKNQLRPFSVKVQPTARNLKPATADLATAGPNLDRALGVLNYLFNGLAYNKGGSSQNYLFLGAWLNHIGPLLFDQQDALGPMVRSLFLINCGNDNLLETAIQRLPSPLGTLTQLINIPPLSVACQGIPMTRRTAMANRLASLASGDSVGTETTASALAPTQTTTTTTQSTPTSTTTPTQNAPSAAPSTTTPTNQTAAVPQLTDVPPKGGER